MHALPDGTHELVQASYDAAGRLIQMTLDDAVTRSFVYDTLGRLTRSKDPDLGARTLTWDDGDRLLTETNATGQTVRYSYDALGRLATRDDGAVYAYHYDVPRPGASGPLTNLRGQLAYVDEPIGGLDLGYDELGRAAFTRRRIDDRASEATTSYAASGLALARSYDDGFSLAYRYDPAGRMIAAGDLWTLVDQDPAGMPRLERTQPGVETSYERDLVELPLHVTVRDANRAAIYDVQATRDLAGQIRTIADLDGVGLDHSATFDYDGFARLTAATAGSGDQALGFTYRYDVLHNMTARTVSRPTPGVFDGTYRYGENQHAQRQLTSIVGPTGQIVHTFDYDAAGREIREDSRTMTYDASDRLRRIDGVDGGAVVHAYGHDGQRIKTVEPGGAVTYLFGDGTAERRGARTHDIAVGARVVARVEMTPAPTDGRDRPATGATGALRQVSAAAIVALALGMVALVLATALARPRRRVQRVARLALLLAASCTGPNFASRTAASTVPVPTFLHAGFAAGPVVFTDASGHLIEERRYEPFGAPIDAHLRSDDADTIGPPDFTARDLNELNQRIEAATGWSDHGARWMTPETGRWLTPDPPVAGPGAGFMDAPWALHPYQYVHQNPVAYWDPDGRQPAPVLAPVPAPPPLSVPVRPPLTLVPPSAPESPGMFARLASGAARLISPLTAAVSAGVTAFFWDMDRGGPCATCSCSTSCGKASPTLGPTPVPVPSPAPSTPGDDSSKNPVWVVRGGVASSENLMRAAIEHPDVPGLFGFSVQSQPGKTVEELARAGEFPHAKISVTTLSALQALGVPVVPTPGPGYHHDAVTGPVLDPARFEEISKLFTVMPNPAQVKKAK